jgi:hypothetical protein
LVLLRQGDDVTVLEKGFLGRESFWAELSPGSPGNIPTTVRHPQLANPVHQ